MKAFKNALMMFFVLTLIPIIGFGCGNKNKNKVLNIAVVPMGSTHEFWKSIHAGAEKAARELGVKVLWKGPLKEDDRDEQLEIIENFTSQKVDAIVVSPMDDRTLVRAVKDAKAIGIPTILVNSGLQGNDCVSFIATENYNGGVMGAGFMGKLMNGKGKIIVVRVSESEVTGRERENGFIATIKKDFPGMEILSDNQYAGLTTETAYRTCENLLNRFPEVEAIFTPNESTTFGCLRALQDKALAGKIKFVGFDSSAKLIEALAKSEIMGLVIQNPVKMGYESVVTAVKVIKGEPFEKRIDTGITIATPENMNNPEIKSLLSPDLSILNE